MIVVGGSGMLGKVIMKRLNCMGTHFNNPSGTVLWTPSIVKDHSVIINCVCDKNVDRCEQNFQEAKKLNADFVDILVRENPMAHLIQISTDYVYADGKVVDPMNIYGITKFLGELKAQRAHRWTVLRVPALYDDPLDVVPTDLTRPVESSDTARYHTSCEDVAEAVHQIVSRQLYGVLNFSASIARSKNDIIRYLNLPVVTKTTTAPRSNHVYIGNDFNILPRELDLAQFRIPRSPFIIIDLDGTLLDTVNLHATCYELAHGDRDRKNQFLKKFTNISFKWNSELLIDFVHENNINHVVLTNTTMDVVDHFRACVPKLNLLKNFVTKDMYTNRKPDLEPYELAMKYNKGEPVMVLDDLVHNLSPMKRYTRLLFHMSDVVHDKTVFTLNDFGRLVDAIRG